MLRIAASLSLVFFAACAPPAPTDAGVVADGGFIGGEGEGEGEGDTGCGDVTPQGSCEGNTVVWCDTDSDTVVEYNCDDYPGSDCMEVNPTYGVDCVSALGDTCGFEDDEGNFTFTWCSGNGGACVEKQDFVAVCEEGQTACDATSIDMCTGSGRYIFECFETVPYLIDCVALGGACQAGDGCGELPAGADCDGDFYRCADGLECGLLNVCAAPADGGVVGDAGPAGDGGVVADSGVAGDAGVAGDSGVGPDGG